MALVNVFWDGTNFKCFSDHKRILREKCVYEAPSFPGIFESVLMNCVLLNYSEFETFAENAASRHRNALLAVKIDR